MRMSHLSHQGKGVQRRVKNVLGGYSRRLLFPEEKIDQLLKAIYSSEQIVEHQRSQSAHNFMYRGVEVKKNI